LSRQSAVKIEEDLYILGLTSVRIDSEMKDTLLDLLRLAWKASEETGMLFRVNLVLTRGRQIETITIGSDCVLSYPENIFGTDMLLCSECNHYIGLFKQISAKFDSSQAHVHTVHFANHLNSCSFRQASVRIRVEIDKSNLAKVVVPESLSTLVRVSIWFQFASLRQKLREMTISDFCRLFAEDFKLWAFAVYDLKELDRCNLLGFSMIPLADMAHTLAGLSPKSVRDRLERLSTDKEGLQHELVAKTGVVPLSTFMSSEDVQSVTRILDCIGHIAAYSLLAQLADQVCFDKGLTYFQLNLPTGPVKVAMKFFTTDDGVLVEIGKDEVRLGLLAIAKLIRNTCEKFAESLGSAVFMSLRKTSIHDLIRQRAYGSIADFLREPETLLNYYANLKEQMLLNRLDQVEEIFDRLWSTATQTSRDLFGMLDTMHKEIEAAAMLIFGTLAFQAYMFASRAITTTQLFRLLFAFSAGLTFFVLFADFRIDGIEENAALVMENLKTIEKQVTSRTGLEASPEWKQLPEMSYKSLGSRMDVIETLLWCFLTVNGAALAYFSYRLFASGINWAIGAFTNPILFVLFVACFLYVRRGQKGIKKLKTRTRIGAFFLAASIMIMLCNAVYSICCHSREIMEFLVSFGRCP